MIPVSDEYKRQLIAGNRNYLIKIPVFLASNQTSTPDFTLTNENIWESGVTIDQATSSSNSFDIGSAVVGSLKVVIDNIKEDYSQYDFLNAHLTLWLGVEGDTENGVQKYYRIGFYVVDEPSYNGSLITLNCLDNMTWFDVPFSGVNFSIDTNTTTGQLVSAICLYVGVSLGQVTFPNYNLTIYKEALKELSEANLNCREVLQYIAQKCCCYCKIDTAGELILNWYNKNEIIDLVDYDGGTYNTTTTPYSDGVALDGGQWYYDGEAYVWTEGDSADGGTFQDLTGGVWISHNFDINVSTDDIVVTGVRVKRTNGDDDSKYDILYVDTTLEQTHDRYVLVIENNPLILKKEVDGTAGVVNIANLIGGILAGLPIRGFSARSLSDFSYETGDMATVVDFRGNVYYTWLTNFSFTTNDSESFSCGVESVRKRNETRFSSAIRTLAEAQDYSNAKLTEYDSAVRAMDELAQNSIGYNEYVYPVGAGVGTSRTMWRYNGTQRTGTASAPLFPNSTVVFKISGDGVFVSRDGGNTYTNGYDANSGTAILNLIYTIGLNCNWIHAGTLTLGGNNNTNGLCTVLDASSNEVIRLSNGGISVKKGTITLGNKTSLTDANTGVYIGSDGIALGASSAFKVTDAGALKATSADITGKVTAESGSIGAWNLRPVSGTGSTPDQGWGALYVGSSFILSPNGTDHEYSVSGLYSDKTLYVKFGNVFAIDTDGVCYVKGTIKGSRLEGTNEFAIQCGSGTTAQKTSTLNWGDTWNDSLVVVSDSNDDASMGVCKKNNKFSKAVYIHWDDIRFYDNSTTPKYAQWGSSKSQSDKRLKKNIKKLTSDTLQTFYSKLNPIIFNYKKEVGIDGTFFGVFAQDMEQALEAIGVDDSPIVSEGSDGYKKLYYVDTIGIQMGAVKDLYEIVNKQQEEIDLLKKELAELKARVK